VTYMHFFLALGWLAFDTVPIDLTRCRTGERTPGRPETARAGR
jgi:hypothetical protein